MLRFSKVGLIVLLVVAMGAVVGSQVVADKQTDASTGQAVTETQGLPKLLDLGSKSCVPCKMMAPILEKLKKDYAGKFEVDFIDVGQRDNAAQAKRYGIKQIPTQIFFDEDGKELWRHEGFMDKAQILAKWKELGFEFSEAGSEDTAKKQALSSAEVSSADNAAQTAETVSGVYPNLASGALVHARMADLPEGTLLRAGELTVTQKQIDEQIAQSPQEMREQLRKNAFFVLEQTATQQLLVQQAKAAAETGETSDQELLKAYFEKLTADVKVSDAEIAEFYEKNKDMVGGKSLKDVKPSIAQYLRGQKQQKIVDEHIKNIGRQMKIEVNAPWLNRQAQQALDNPVHEARTSGKPTLVDFGSKGCRPCDMLQPILENLRQKYDGRANILFVSVREEQMLASRYGVQSIPTLVFFDEDGKQAFRHTGFMKQEELEKKLAEIGVK